MVDFILGLIIGYLLFAPPTPITYKIEKIDADRRDGTQVSNSR